MTGFLSVLFSGIGVGILKIVYHKYTNRKNLNKYVLGEEFAIYNINILKDLKETRGSKHLFVDQNEIYKRKRLILDLQDQGYVRWRKKSIGISFYIWFYILIYWLLLVVLYYGNFIKEECSIYAFAFLLAIRLSFAPHKHFTSYVIFKLTKIDFTMKADEITFNQKNKEVETN